MSKETLTHQLFALQCGMVLRDYDNPIEDSKRQEINVSDAIAPEDLGCGIFFEFPGMTDEHAPKALRGQQFLAVAVLEKDRVFVSTVIDPDTHREKGLKLAALMFGRFTRPSAARLANPDSIWQWAARSSRASLDGYESAEVIARETPCHCGRMHAPANCWAT